MKYDVIVIGAGLSGLSAAGLLAKRGLKVVVVEQGSEPGGSCGIFKRHGAVFDQGAAMLYGFGKKGFNAHRFLFNCLEESFEVVKHELLYVVHYNGKKIRFWSDIDRFIEELSQVFPMEKENIRRFYKEMQKMYIHVMSETPNYTTPDETNPKDVLRNVVKHPISYLKFLSYLNISTEKLLRQYFQDSEILKFFDKLTSTYCYATIEEAPAILASVMFIDNHEGGSYYPAGSTLFLPGKLEKVIEEYDGEMRYESLVKEILFKHNTCSHPFKIYGESNVSDGGYFYDAHGEKAIGVLLESGEKLYAEQIIYSGTVWNLYEKLLPRQVVTEKEYLWAKNQIPTYPSVVLYALVDSAAIPEETSPIEMLAANPDAIDESEITVYIMSIDDHTLCSKHQHTVVAIGPSFKKWEMEDEDLYETQKQEEMDRMISSISRYFPDFEAGLLYCELATPKTIERYTMKNGGAAAGPKQMLGQHMLMRQSIRTRWKGLYCCGDSTTMGTGTPTVTTSGIAAANAVLKKRGMKPYVWEADMRNYVHVLRSPVKNDWMYQFYPQQKAEIMELAGRCLYCETLVSCDKKVLDLTGIIRRTACGNFTGAKRLMEKGLENKSLQGVLKDMSDMEDMDDKQEEDRRREIIQVLEYLQDYILI